MKKSRFLLLLPVFAGLLAILAVVYIRYGLVLFKDPVITREARPGEEIAAFLDTLDRAPLSVRVESRQDTWIQIRRGEDEEEAFLQRGASQQMTVQEEVVLGMDDPSHLRLFVNEKLLRIDTSAVALWLSLAPGMPAVWSVRQSRPAAVQESRTAAVPVPVLTGHVEPDTLWKVFPQYRLRQARYKPDSIRVAALREVNPGLSVVVYFATWDTLSAEIVPRLMSILETAALEGISLNLIGLDRDMKDSAGMVDFHRILGVPTVLFLMRGQELGRIVGQPGEGLEEQLLEIARRGERLRPYEETRQDTIH